AGLRSTSARTCVALRAPRRRRHRVRSRVAPGGRGPIRYLCGAGWDRASCVIAIGESGIPGQTHSDPAGRTGNGISGTASPNLDGATAPAAALAALAGFLVELAQEGQLLADLRLEPARNRPVPVRLLHQIGRASCREGWAV